MGTYSKNILKNLCVLLIMVVLLYRCTYKNTAKETAQLISKFKKDTFELRGTYYWNFKLMGATQKSINTFYGDSIVYKMDGEIYATKYTIQKISYNKKEHKWIGEDENKNVYVLFFKNLKDDGILVYKRKCKKKALKEALAFTLPKPDATQDHGWNTYSKEDNLMIDDIVPFIGKYVAKEHTLSIEKDLLILDNNEYQKLSYHKGERRWVGKLKGKERYLQLFFKSFKTTYQEIHLEIQNHSDLEKMYKTKYNDTNEFIKFIQK